MVLDSKMISKVIFIYYDFRIVGGEIWLNVMYTIHKCWIIMCIIIFAPLHAQANAVSSMYCWINMHVDFCMQFVCLRLIYCV